MSVAEGERRGSSATRIVLCLAAFVAFIVLFFGAIRTSAQIWAGISPEHLALSQSVLIAKGHEHAGNLLALLLVISTWLAWRTGRRFVFWLTAAAAIAALCELLTGFLGPMQLTSLRTYTHVVCGHLTFACIAGAAVILLTRTSPPVKVNSEFPVKELGGWIPVLVLIQVAMGSAYRHNFWSIMPHMAGAIVVAFLFVAEGVTLLQQVPDHRTLSLAAKSAIGIVIAQIALGVTDFILRLLDFQTSPAWFLVSIAHVCIGSLTFATSICLAAAIRACVAD